MGARHAADEAFPRAGMRGCTEIYTKRFRAFIISLVNLGDKFAVRYGGVSTHGLNVYDFPCNLNLSVQRDVGNIQYLAATPDGNIAALDDGNVSDIMRIRVFDPETGWKISTRKIRAKPLGRTWSFGVTGFGHYVILHSVGRVDDDGDSGQYCYGDDDDDEDDDNEKILEDEDTRVSVYKDDGSFVLSRGVRDDSRFISCSEKNVFISGGHHVDAYELDDEKLVKITTSQHFHSVLGVSAAPGGEVTVVRKKRKGGWYIGRAMLHNNRFSEWQFEFVSDKRLSLVSVAGGHIVVAGNENADGRKCLRIFEEEKNDE